MSKHNKTEEKISDLLKAINSLDHRKYSLQKELSFSPCDKRVGDKT